MQERGSSGRLIADGKYELLRIIGEGGMGTVYLARHVVLGRTVAIKVLNPQTLNRPDAAERFLGEARLVSQLRHQNTVQLLDFGTDGNEYWLVMEHLQGRDLAEILETQEKLPPIRALSIATQLLAALSEAHDAGIVHCDLKPANIMIIPWQDDAGMPMELVKVLDFGIAKLAEDSRPTNEVAGTPAYMSPEQAQGLGLDARSDLYAVGIILHEMLTGAAPFNFPDLIATMLAQVKKPPPFLCDLAPELPVELETCLQAALAKDPVVRFQHARTFRNRLLEISEQLAPSRRRPQTDEKQPVTDRAVLATPEPTQPSKARLSWVLWVFAGAALLASVAALGLVLKGSGALDDGDGVNLVSTDGIDATAMASDADPVLLTPPAMPSDAGLTEVEPDSVAAGIVDVEVGPDDAGIGTTAAPAETVDMQAVAATTDNADMRGADEAGTQVAIVQPLATTPPRTLAPVTPPVITRPVVSPPAVTTPPVTTPEVVPDPTPAPTTPTTPTEVPPTRAPALAAKATPADLSVQGSLPRSSVQRALDGARTAFEGCYASGATSANRDAAGAVGISFDVNEDGQFQRVEVQAFELPGVSGCVKDVLMRLRTRDRPDTGTVRADARIRFVPLQPR